MMFIFVVSVTLFSLVSSDTLYFKPDQPDSVLCPDKQGTCPDNNTCCQLFSGQYGCCPLPEAVCCSDHTHCCPHGYTCDVARARCLNGDKAIDWVPKVAAEPVDGSDVTCPESNNPCSRKQTCCLSPSGNPGCCPFTNAICCPDGKHCCPPSYTCDRGHSACAKSEQSIGWLDRLFGTPVSASHPDGATSLSLFSICPFDSACPNQYSCCPVSGGNWGCCNLPLGVCCNDGSTCCPFKYSCDPITGKCHQPGQAELRERGTVILSHKPSRSDGICPGGKYKCEGDQTCCPVKAGAYGCCPFPNGVCCRDKKHCCPRGFTCSLEKGACTRAGGSSLLLENLAEAKSSTLEVKDTPTSPQIAKKTLRAFPKQQRTPPEKLTPEKRTSTKTFASIQKSGVETPKGVKERERQGGLKPPDRHGGVVLPATMGQTGSRRRGTTPPSESKMAANMDRKLARARLVKAVETVTQGVREQRQARQAAATKQKFAAQQPPSRRTKPALIPSPVQKQQGGKIPHKTKIGDNDKKPPAHKTKTGDIITKPPAHKTKMKDITKKAPAHKTKMEDISKKPAAHKSEPVVHRAPQKVVQKVQPIVSKVQPNVQKKLKKEEGRVRPPSVIVKESSLVRPQKKKEVPPLQSPAKLKKDETRGQSTLPRKQDAEKPIKLQTEKAYHTAPLPKQPVKPRKPNKVTPQPKRINEKAYHTLPPPKQPVKLKQPHKLTGTLPPKRIDDASYHTVKQPMKPRQPVKRAVSPQPNIVVSKVHHTVKQPMKPRQPVKRAVTPQPNIVVSKVHHTANVPKQPVIPRQPDKMPVTLPPKRLPRQPVLRARRDALQVSGKSYKTYTQAAKAKLTHATVEVVKTVQEKHRAAQQQPPKTPTKLPEHVTKSPPLQLKKAVVAPVKPAKQPLQRPVLKPLEIKSPPLKPPLKSPPSSAKSPSKSPSLKSPSLRSPSKSPPSTSSPLKSPPLKTGPLKLPTPKSHSPSKSPTLKTATIKTPPIKQPHSKSPPLKSVSLKTPPLKQPPSKSPPLKSATLKTPPSKSPPSKLPPLKQHPKPKSPPVVAKVVPTPKNKVSPDIARKSKQTLPQKTSKPTTPVSPKLSKETGLPNIAKKQGRTPTSPSGDKGLHGKVVPSKLAGTVKAQKSPPLSLRHPVTGSPPNVDNKGKKLAAVKPQPGKAPQKSLGSQPAPHLKKDSLLKKINKEEDEKAAGKKSWFRSVLGFFGAGSDKTDKDKKEKPAKLQQKKMRPGGVSHTAPSAKGLQYEPAVSGQHKPQVDKTTNRKSSLAVLAAKHAAELQKQRLAKQKAKPVIQLPPQGQRPLPRTPPAHGPASKSTKDKRVTGSGSKQKPAAPPVTGEGSKAKRAKTAAMVKPMSAVKKADTHVVKGTIVCPGGKASCPAQTTCCLMKDQRYGCCPLTKAVCCNDHLHCCPEGTTCNSQRQTCDQSKSSSPALKKLTPPKQTSVVCPDKSSACPDGNTCCKLKSGQYGCCPLPKAVCCSDHQHCCPTGTKCEGGYCSGDSVTTSWHTLEGAALHNDNRPKNHKCPDRRSSCPIGTTCCQMLDKYYACCPLPKAVCCSDHLHCCPNGYTCDVKQGTCNKGSVSIPWNTKQPAQPKTNNVICPDPKFACPDGTTCCKLQSGEYGCCPFTQAVCCSDYLHCCPNGYTCDVAQSTCTKGSVSLPWSTKVAATPKTNDIVCPDRTSACPDGTTCCKLESGQYGCCPYPNAVCCSDHQHCCPNGYTCDVAQSTCTKGSVSLPWSTKLAATPKTNIVCPDQTSTCPDGTTCCKLQSGQYGCCPYPNAVCCSDHQHCCPNGYTCDVAQSTCTKGSVSLPWSTKLAATPNTNNIICPDQMSTCPDENTCCKLESGQYGCCPYPNAVCCSDHQHCCPNGYTCDVAQSACTKGSVSLPWSTKLAATRKTNIVCPDRTSTCPDGTTCCKLESGQYGCCPYPNAVCCSDHQHCCPNGYTCNVAQSTCTKGSVSVHWSAKLTATPKTNDIVCPDRTSACPDGTTCCKLQSGQYGCCPYPNAVCCSDHQHCCPNGYTCDVAQSTCTKGSVSLPWSTKLPAIAKTNNVICPDPKYACPDGSTCCKLQSGEYGCCPYPTAVCCSDYIHCCPHGYTCDVSKAACVKGPWIFPWLGKATAALRVSSAPSGSRDVPCPGGTAQCPSNNTCCLLPDQTYGCCPFPNATCCAGTKYCCPHGYRCDTQHAQCVRTTEQVLLSVHLASIDPVGSVCPYKSTCTGDQTCCRLLSGRYGCCPFPQAQCCSDGLHCCPMGTTCDLAHQMCRSHDNSMSVGWSPVGRKSLLPDTELRLAAVVCPDHTECPTGQTCCKLPTGKYGCCSLQKATCCKDGLHCCPEGTVCDDKGQKCKKKGTSLSVDWTQFSKLPATGKPTSGVVCPDKYKCPDSTTCCKTETGQYACCPIPNAVCCQDGVHCCPHGSQCDNKQQWCSQTMPWFTKQPAIRDSKPDSVICPDKLHECPEGNTCCRLPNREWGCCPMPHAVCCSDHLHCCPQGYTCDVRTSQCYLRGDNSNKKVSAASINKAATKGGQ